MRGVHLCCLAMIAIVVCLLLAGCSGPRKSDAVFLLNWPGVGETQPICAVQSVKIIILDGYRTVSTQTVERSDWPQTTVTFTDVRFSNYYTFLATAYDGPIATGSILGQTGGYLRVQSGEFIPVTLTTLIDPGATLAITPDSPTVYIDHTLAMRVTAYNPDLSYAFLPTDAVHWTSHDTDVATINLTSGVLTGVAEGDARISANTNTSPAISGETTVTVRYEPPSVNLTADKSTVDQGDNTTLRWTSARATSVYSTSGFHTTALNGSSIISPGEKTTYSITVVGPGGYDTDEVTVDVKYPEPDVTLTADSTNISAGQSTVLRWQSSNATSVTSTTGFTTTAPTGSAIIAPGATTTYSISVRGPGGTDSASVTVSVSGGTGARGRKK